jgi:hypothetical protein
MRAIISLSTPSQFLSKILSKFIHDVSWVILIWLVVFERIHFLTIIFRFRFLNLAPAPLLALATRIPSAALALTARIPSAALALTVRTSSVPVFSAAFSASFVICVSSCVSRCVSSCVSSCVS